LQVFLTQQSQKPENIFYASVVTYAEMHATFTRAWKGRRINEIELEQMRIAFDQQWLGIHLAEAGITTVLRAGVLAKSHALRGCDAFQLASALAVEAQLFISSDTELNEAAKQEGLPSWNPAAGGGQAD
jgi:predicted nucleic acid-binding protein